MSALVDSANARVFSARAAGALGGERRAADRVASHVSSRLDPFLNQVFGDVGGDPEEAVRRLAGRPSFVWLASPPDAVTRVCVEADGFALMSFTAMHADIADEPVAEPSDTLIEPVDTGEGLAAWHGVYCEGLGADPRSVDDWRKLYRDLGPGGRLAVVVAPARRRGTGRDGRALRRRRDRGSVLLRDARTVPATRARERADQRLPPPCPPQRGASLRPPGVRRGSPGIRTRRLRPTGGRPILIRR